MSASKWGRTASLDQKPRTVVTNLSLIASRSSDSIWINVEIPHPICNNAQSGDGAALFSRTNHRMHPGL